MRPCLLATAFLLLIPHCPPALGLPAGWKQLHTTDLPAIQLAGLSRRLGGRLTAAKNIHYNVRGAELKLIELSCQSTRDAQMVYQTMTRLKQGERFLRLDGRKVSEIVSRSNRASIEATYVFGFQPAEVTYRVEFDAVPIQGGDYLKWNQLFNAFLRHRQAPAPAAAKEIARLAKSFRIGGTIELRKYGQGPALTTFTTRPASPETRGGLPVSSVTATIRSRTIGFTPAGDTNGLTGQTAHWPVDDPAIQALAKTITRDAPSPDHRVQAILKWFLNRDHIRFDGKIKGSRYGVEKVIAQKFGHCWDYADVFVTLCRASGVPARQVLGWNNYLEGHVWAEVLKPGQGWIPIDPTSGMACGSEYIPIMTTTDGEIPFVYASRPRITVLKP